MKKRVVIIAAVALVTTFMAGAAEVAEPGVNGAVPEGVGKNVAGPANWRFERIPIPPPFAPDIRLHGVEEVRFAPGMFDTGSSNYFTYVVLLSVDCAEAIDGAALKDFLEKYYRGLSAGVGRRKGLVPDVSQIGATVTSVRPGDATCTSHVAGVTFFDTFNDGRKIELRMEIEVRPKPGSSRTVITLLISPQPATADVWRMLREIGGTIEPSGPQ